MLRHVTAIIAVVGVVFAASWAEAQSPGRRPTYQFNNRNPTRVVTPPPQQPFNPPPRFVPNPLYNPLYLPTYGNPRMLRAPRTNPYFNPYYYPSYGNRW